MSKNKDRVKDAAILNTKIVGGVIVVGLITIIAVFFVMSSSNEEKQLKSNVANMTPPDNQFNVKVPESYRKALAENDEKEMRHAVETGNSAVSTILPESGDNDSSQNRQQQVPVSVQTEGSGAIPQNNTPKPQYTEEQKQNATAMISALMGQWQTPPMSLAASISLPEDVNSTNPGEGSNSDTSTSGITTPETMLLSKGSTCYATLNSVINTDYKNVVISATLASCKSENIDFSGGTLLGKYERNYDKVGVTFDALKYKNTSYSISAIAIDENTQQGLLSGDVDRHMMARYVLPTLTAIASGWASASQRENTTVTTNINGTTASQGAVSDQDKYFEAGAAAGKALDDVVKDSLNGRTITVEIDPKPGQGIGVVFLADITTGGK
jgi:hypothetical protein